MKDITGMNPVTNELIQAEQAVAAKINPSVREEFLEARVRATEIENTGMRDALDVTKKLISTLDEITSSRAKAFYYLHEMMGLVTDDRKAFPVYAEAVQFLNETLTGQKK